MESAIKRIILAFFLEFAVFLLADVLAVCTGHTQTVDSLNVSSGGTSGSSGAMILTTIPMPDGKILAAGDAVKFVGSNNQSHTNLARINSDGSVDDAFVVNVAGAQPAGLFIDCLALQTNGQILIGGAFANINGLAHYNIGRLYADGTLDTNFNAGYINDSINSVLVQPDGQILICGSFTKVDSKSCTGLCRLNYDGSLDANFNAGSSNTVMSTALQSDGKIIAEGSFASIGGQSRTNLARLNADGSFDSSFQPVVFTAFGQTGISGFGGAVLIQPDGKILVGGLFDKVNGLSHTNIVRLNKDGTLDTAFNAQADLYDSWGLQTLALQTDGKILVGDDSLTLDGQSCPYLGRLNADGSLDASFNTNLVGSGAMVFSSTAQQDGKILTAGLFGKLGGLTRNEFGRLINTDAATQSLDYDGTNIVWLRGGTSPEVWRASFEASTNGADWIYLGDGCPIGSGWQLTNILVSTNATIRARGFVAGGRFDGSSWFVESVYPQTTPTIVTSDGNLGFQTNQFGFNVGGSAGSTVVIDTSSTLFDWTPMATNMLPSGPLYFNDPASTNFLQRFYRARLQQ